MTCYRLRCKTRDTLHKSDLHVDLGHGIMMRHDIDIVLHELTCFKAIGDTLEPKPRSRDAD